MLREDRAGEVGGKGRPANWEKASEELGGSFTHLPRPQSVKSSFQNSPGHVRTFWPPYVSYFPKATTLQEAQLCRGHVLELGMEGKKCCVVKEGEDDHTPISQRRGLAYCEPRLWERNRNSSFNFPLRLDRCNC